MLQSCLSQAVNLTLAENYYVGMFFWTCRRAFTVQLVSLFFRRKRPCVAEIQPMQSWLKVAEVNSFSSCLHHHPVLETWKAEREPATQWTSLSPPAIAGLAYVSEILTLQVCSDNAVVSAKLRNNVQALWNHALDFYRASSGAMWEY